MPDVKKHSDKKSKAAFLVLFTMHWVVFKKSNGANM